MVDNKDNPTIPFRQVKPAQKHIFPLDDFLQVSDLTLEREGDNCRLSLVVPLEALELFTGRLADLVIPETQQAEKEKAKKRKANNAAAKKSRKNRDKETAKTGKIIHNAVEAYRADGADLNDARRAVAVDLHKTSEQIEYFDVFYRKKNNIEKIKRDARIMRFYRAGHSNAEIGNREGLHEKSVARLIGKYRRENPSALAGEL